MQSQAPAHCFWHFYLFCFYFLRYLSTDSGSHLFLLAACTKSYIRKDPHGGDYCKMNPYVHTVPCISIHPDFWDAFLYHIWILRSLLVLLGKVAQALKSCHRSDSLCSVLCLDHSNTFRFLVLNPFSVGSFSYAQVSCKLEQDVFQDCAVYASSHLALNPDQLPSPY